MISSYRRFGGTYTVLTWHWFYLKTASIVECTLSLLVLVWTYLLKVCLWKARPTFWWQVRYSLDDLKHHVVVGVYLACCSFLFKIWNGTSRSEVSNLSRFFELLELSMRTCKTWHREKGILEYFRPVTDIRALKFFSLVSLSVTQSRLLVWHLNFQFLPFPSDFNLSCWECFPEITKIA